MGSKSRALRSVPPVAGESAADAAAVEAALASPTPAATEASAKPFVPPTPAELRKRYRADIIVLKGAEAQLEERLVTLRKRIAQLQGADDGMGDLLGPEGPA